MNRLRIAREILKVARLVASVPGLKLVHRNRGYHDQQSDNSIVAIMDGKVVGFLDYSEYHGEVHVQMIKVDEQFRRKGIGTALLRELDKEYPEVEIEYGMETPEGARLIEEYQRRYPKKLDFERGVSNRDFVLSFVPDCGKNADQVSWHTSAYAFSETGLDLHDYDFNWAPSKEQFEQDIKRVTNKGWATAAKQLRSDLRIKTNAEVKVAKELLTATRPIRIDRRVAEGSVDRLIGVLKRHPDKPLGSSLDFADSVTIRDVKGQDLEVEVQYRSKPGGKVFDMVLAGGAGKTNKTKRPAVLLMVNGIYKPEDFASSDSDFRHEATTALMHELTHSADVYAKPLGPASQRVRTEDELDLQAYYNHPSEVRAYLREMVEDVARDLPEFLRHFKKNEAVARLVKLSPTWDRIKPYLTERNKGLVLKGVYQSVEDFLYAKTASLKTFREIRDELDPDGKRHDLRLVCDVCGDEETCRCMKPKREFHGICYDCAEKQRTAGKEVRRFFKFQYDRRTKDKIKRAIEEGSGFALKRVYMHTNGVDNVLEINTDVPYDDLDFEVDSMSSPFRSLRGKPSVTGSGITIESFENIYGPLGRPKAVTKLAGVGDNQQYDTDNVPKRLTPTWDMPTLGDEPLSEITTTWRSVNPMERGRHLMMSRELLRVAKEVMALEQPDWSKPEFADSLAVPSGLKRYSGKLHGMPVWALQGKGKIYKDQYGWISYGWSVNPVVSGSDWVARSTLSFAPATSGTFANQRFQQFKDEVRISGSAGAAMFGGIAMLLEANTPDMIVKMIEEHDRDLQAAKKFWKKQKLAVSLLPNDVRENGYPQEYMPPSPGGMGSVRPGDDIMLTGRRGRLVADDESPEEIHRWIQEVLKLEPSALACSGIKSRKAFEFPTDKALKEYLKEHPGADRKLHWIERHHRAPTAPGQRLAPVEKKFGVHRFFDIRHPVSEQENRFRALMGSPDPSNPWQVKDKDAIRQYLTKKLGQKPKYDDLQREIQQRTKAGEVISYAFWSSTKHANDPTFRLDMVTNRRGVPQGLVTSYENEDHELEIGALASSGQVRGMGTYLIAKTIREKLKKGERLTLSALDTAKPFYQKIGMKPVDPIGPYFYFDYQDARKFADRVYKELGSRRKSAGKIAAELFAMLTGGNS